MPTKGKPSVTHAAHNFKLAKRLDNLSAKFLADELTLARGKELTIDASEVEVIGTLCVQALVAAERQWAQDDCVFQTVTPSAAFSNTCAGLGVPLEELNVTIETES